MTLVHVERSSFGVKPGSAFSAFPQIFPASYYITKITTIGTSI